MKTKVLSSSFCFDFLLCGYFEFLLRGVYVAAHGVWGELDASNSGNVRGCLAGLAGLAVLEKI